MTQYALVTGGTSGIGKAIVMAFLGAGYAVLTCGRDADKIAQLKAECTDRDLQVIQASVTDESWLAGAKDVLEGWGQLDVLVNNAGVIISFGGLDEEIEAWQETMNTNVVAAHALAQVCHPFLLKSKAHPSIINISSVCSLRAFKTCSSLVYSSSKAALDMMTLKLAQSLGVEGVRVNSVNPGVVRTPIWDGGYERMEELGASQHVLGKVVEPEDIADAVMFLASDKARMITGAILPVDAGYNLG